MKYIMQNSKSNYNQIIDNIINERKKEIFSFFKSEEINLPVTIYVYNSIEELVKGMRERGFKNDPDYMCACQKDEDNSLNYFEPKDNSDKNRSSYYKTISGKDWGNADNYDLCIDSSIGAKETANIVINYINSKKK